jgi:D-alanyl-D-alanine carboxypeptidase (penicillin-binding protein 5/6)
MVLALVLVLVFPMAVAGTEKAADLEVTAESCVLLEADSGQILYTKNPDQRLAPASMTKLMTLILACEDLEKGKVGLKDQVVTSEEAWRLGGSQIWLEPGEEMSFEDMLIAIAVGSANDACVAVAEHLEGSHEAFVARMNAEAQKMGLKNTHFVNSYGLPAEGHYSCARDMAVMGRYALRFPKLMEFSAIKEYHLRQGDLVLYNTNKLLWYYPGADGFKTGWTNEARFCLAATAKRDGLRLVSAVFAAPDKGGNFRDSMKLFNYGFARYAYRSFFGAGSQCGMVRVGKGVEDQVEAVAAEQVGAACPRGQEKKITYTADLPGYVNAPVKKGQRLGEISIYNDGKLIKKVNLVAYKAVDRGGLIRQLGKTMGKIFLI